MFTGETCTLVNRTSKPLKVKYDGREYTLKPGENVVPRELVKHAREQNPVMGAENWQSPSKFPSLVGVLGTHDCSPIEQTDAVERFDSETIPGRMAEAPKPKKGAKGAAAKPRSRARVIQGSGDPDPTEARVASVEEGESGGFIDSSTLINTK